jgi:thioredoxin-related protein
MKEWIHAPLDSTTHRWKLKSDEYTNGFRIIKYTRGRSVGEWIIRDNHNACISKLPGYMSAEDVMAIAEVVVRMKV